MAKTFLSIAVDTLKQASSPLTVDEIWQQAQVTGSMNGFVSKGKTPIATLAAQIYTDLKKGAASQFQIVSKKPTRFSILENQVPQLPLLTSSLPAGKGK